ncbi:U-box domain-containing protein 73-like [Panicum miliaceum]|uniref:U-box domain-containing protein 73-like n=1 Tax=Panicum miliaceum TaxID=4540 RepID=A0A3L6RUW7_PANMI|nr:U-box domain-containing protein 73-like [Panicum miliaceum]
MSSAASAEQTLEHELLRAERETQENARAISSAQPPRTGCCPSSPSSLVRGVTRRAFGVATGSSPRSLPTRRSLPRSSPRGQASSDVGTSGSAPRVRARTAREEEARSEQDQAALTRSSYGVMMRSALVNIEEIAEAEGQEQAPFAKTELTYGKAELPNPPELPREVATRWPHGDEQALHVIHLLSKITKGEQPCLHKWPGLFPELIDLHKNWKSTSTQDLEEQRLGVILNLSVHRFNRDIIARENRLPAAVKKIVAKLHKHGSPASAFTKVASIVAILSELDLFRKRILDIGGMEMLRDLLKIEDVVVRKEAVAAIRALCADEEGKTYA